MDIPSSSDNLSISSLDMNTTKFSTIELRKMKDLFLYLDPQIEKEHSIEEKQRIHRLSSNLTLLSSISNIKGMYHQRQWPALKVFKFLDIVPRLTHLLRECVLSHRWPEALRTVESLIDEQNDKADSSIYNVGLAALQQTEEDEHKMDLVSQFVRQIVHLKKVMSLNVYLDYLLFLMTTRHLDSAKEIKREKKVLAQQMNTPQLCQVNTLFMAYQGLVLYSEWKVMAIMQTPEENDEDLVSQMMSQGRDSEMAKRTAEESMGLMEKFKGQEGVWDIFVSCYVEMQGYYGHDVREILVSYSKENPCNPNAHRYLYQYDASQEASEKSQIASLKALVQLDPCNPLALSLFEKLEDTSPSAVKILFDYLDFDHVKDDAKAWRKLNNALKKIDESKELCSAVRECWSVRHDWWPTTRLSGREGDAPDVAPDVAHCRRKVWKKLKALMNSG